MTANRIGELFYTLHQGVAATDTDLIGSRGQQLLEQVAMTARHAQESYELGWYERALDQMESVVHHAADWNADTQNVLGIARELVDLLYDLANA